MSSNSPSPPSSRIITPRTSYSASRSSTRTRTAAKHYGSYANPDDFSPDEDEGDHEFDEDDESYDAKVKEVYAEEEGEEEEDEGEEEIVDEDCSEDEVKVAVSSVLSYRDEHERDSRQLTRASSQKAKQAPSKKAPSAPSKTPSKVKANTAGMTKTATKTKTKTKMDLKPADNKAKKSSSMLPKSKPASKIEIKPKTKTSAKRFELKPASKPVLASTSKLPVKTKNTLVTDEKVDDKEEDPETSDDEDRGDLAAKSPTPVVLEADEDGPSKKAPTDQPSSPAPKEEEDPQLSDDELALKDDEAQKSKKPKSGTEPLQKGEASDKSQSKAETKLPAKAAKRAAPTTYKTSNKKKIQLAPAKSSSTTAKPISTAKCKFTPLIPKKDGKDIEKVKAKEEKSTSSKKSHAKISAATVARNKSIEIDQEHDESVHARKINAQEDDAKMTQEDIPATPKDRHDDLPPTPPTSEPEVGVTPAPAPDATSTSCSSPKSSPNDKASVKVKSSKMKKVAGTKTTRRPDADIPIEVKVSPVKKHRDVTSSSDYESGDHKEDEGSERDETATQVDDSQQSQTVILGSLVTTTSNEAEEHLEQDAELDAEPSSQRESQIEIKNTTPKKRKRVDATPSQDTSPSTSSTSTPSKKKLAPAEKVTSAQRELIISAFLNPTYLQTLKYATIATSDMTASKLSRHWRECPGPDLKAYFVGNGNATKRSAAKGANAIGPEWRKKIWEDVVCPNYDKADWKAMEEAAQGQTITKLKRHFRDVMRKEVSKFIGQ